MQLITNVTLKAGSFVSENKTEVIAECQAIEMRQELELEYDGRDVLITFPLYAQIEITKWCQLILGLFNGQSNFKQFLFKKFSFLRCKKKIEFIFFEVNGVIIEVKKDSNPYNLMRSYFRKQGYLVFDTDTELEIMDRNEKLQKLYIFIYQLFLKEYNNSDSILPKKHAFFFSKEEKRAYMDVQFKKFLQDFELDFASSDESEKLLILLKEQLLH